MADQFPINLEFILDQAAIQRVKAGVSTAADEIKATVEKGGKVDVFNAAKTVADAKKVDAAVSGTTAKVTALGKEIGKLQKLTPFEAAKKLASNTALYDEIEKKTAHIGDGIERVRAQTVLWEKAFADAYPELYKTAKAEDATAEAEKKRAAVLKTLDQQERAHIRNLRVQIREITVNNRVLQDQASDLDRIINPVQKFGAFATTGIFALAAKYVKDAKVATTVTKEWKSSQDQMNKSGERIGAIFAREVLPIIKQVSSLTDRIADTLEKNPRLAGAALKVGLIALTLGTIGKAVTSGIRLYADIKLDAALALQVSAAELQIKASENQLKAAGIQATASETEGAATAGGTIAGQLAGGAKTAGLIGIGLIMSKLAVDIVNGILNKTGVNDKITSAQQKIVDSGARAYPGIIPPKMIEEAKKAKSGVEELSISLNKLAGSAKEADVVKAFTNWKEEDARIVKEAMEKRVEIVKDAEKRVVDAAREYTKAVSDISTTFGREAGQIKSTYYDDLEQMDEDYQDQRANIVSSGNESVRQIEADHQENLRQMAKDFALEQEGYIADRDALGLAKARRQYDDQVGEAERATNQAIRQQRKDIADQLVEAAKGYAEQREQRQQQYEADKKDNAARRAQAMKEASDHYQEELKQARDAKAQQLKDLDEAVKRERLAKREQFIATVRDLDASLLGERQLKQGYYNAMLGDAERFLEQYRAALNLSGSASGLSAGASGGLAATAGSNPNPNFPGLYGTKDSGGYIGRGIYAVAQNNKPEYVLDNPTMRAAESAIGSQLSNDKLMQMIRLFGAMRNSMSYVDNRQFDSEVSARTRRDIRNDTMQALDELLSFRS